jgi:hypothetical protein
MSATVNTPFRIPKTIKEPAVARATAEGRTLTDVVLAHLAEYGSEPPAPAQRPATRKDTTHP